MATPFDDADPRITYSDPIPGLTSWTTSTGNPKEFQATSHVTSQAGSKAVITFKGSSISVFGSVGFEEEDATYGPVSTYTVDGGIPQIHRSVPNPGSMLYKELFFESMPLDASQEHTLVIENTEPGKNPYRLDYIKIRGASGIDPTLVNIDGVTRNANNSTGGETQVTVSHKMVIWGAIGAILALICLVAITIMVFMILRRGRRKGYDASGDDQSDSSWWPCKRKKPSKITPFTYASPSDLQPLRDYPRRPRRPREYPGYDPDDNDTSDSEALIGMHTFDRNDRRAPPAYHNLSVRQPPTGSRAAERGSVSSTDDKRRMSESSSRLS